jgi:hypothetical protein
VLKIKTAALLLALPLAVQASSLTLVSGSISDSLTASSDGLSDSSKSSNNAAKTAAGDYRVTDVADAAGNTRQKRLALQALNPRQQVLYLYMNRDEYARAGLQPGALVSAVAHPYGVSFSAQGGQQAFAVVLDDTWIKELDPRPVAP